MTNADMAGSYLRQAEQILLEAKGLYRRRAWNLVVRRSRDALDASLTERALGRGVS